MVDVMADGGVVRDDLVSGDASGVLSQADDA
jgi:hypothetical protein